MIVKMSLAGKICWDFVDLGAGAGAGYRVCVITNRIWKLDNFSLYLMFALPFFFSLSFLLCEYNEEEVCICSECVDKSK